MQFFGLAHVAHAHAQAHAHLQHLQQQHGGAGHFAQPLVHPQPHHAHPHMAHHGHAHAHGHHAHAQHHAVHPSVSVEFLQSLAIQAPLDVYDIHETGWRRAILLAKRDRHEFLVRYIGWDSKWDEWIRGSSGRLAPSNSRTASLAYTGFKGPKSADEIASIELGRDWNAARQEGVMCDVLFALHIGANGRGLRVGNVVPMSVSPLKRNNSEARSGVSQSAPSTPATSPMVRGLSGLGLISPRLAPINSPSSAASSAPLYFSAHSHMITMRCPDLLKQSLINLPPVTSFEEAASLLPRSASMSNEERKDESGGRSLADQEASAAAAGISASPPSVLGYHLSEVDHAPSASPDMLSATPTMEEKATSLDDDDDMPLGSLNRSASFNSNSGGYSELHPTVTTYDVACVPNAAIMQNLLTYIYTGDLAMNFLPTIRHVFELATTANLLHLDRLQDLCALALNRMLTQDNFLMALKLGLHFQAKVLGNLDTICSALQDASNAATQSLASEIHSSLSVASNAKIHSQLSALVRVSFEYIALHWDLCWNKHENLLALQQLPPQIFQLVMRLMPLKNIASAPFAAIYPSIHPQACNLTVHFKRLYHERTEENTDFRVIVGEGEHEHVIHVHKAVLACRSEYFRALFRCSFEEGKDSCVRLDETQHNPASTEALVKYLYSADLKVDPNCGVYLSNCTDFFGLSSSALEHACQELVSQHHCLKVLKSAWKSCNESLFKRAVKFIDWTTLATLMHSAPEPTIELEGAQHEGLEDMELGEPAELEDEDDQPEEEPEEVDDVHISEGPDDEDEEIEDAEEEPEVEDDIDDAAAVAAAPAVASQTVSPGSSSFSTPILPRSRSASSPASPSVDASDVEMWKAVVFCKAHPSSPAGFKPTIGSALKRSRSTSAN